MSVSEPLTIRRPGQLLADILAYCADHPYGGEDRPSGDIRFEQHYDSDTDTRTAWVVGDAPGTMAVSTELLDSVDQKLVTFERGILTLNVLPNKLMYRPLYLGRGAASVMFEYVCPRCHNTRKVPDWKNWNREYGEPRPKPCPDCVD